MTVLSHGQLQSARHLLQRRGRDTSKRFLAEGAQAVREALATAGVVEMVIVDDVGKHADLLSGWTGQVVTADPTQLRRLSDTVTQQGVFAVCRQRWFELSDLAEPRLVVICDQIRDPGNAGSVIRCADAFGADAVVFTEGSVELHNPKTVRASVGSIFHLPIVAGVGFADAAAWARDTGMRLLAADAGGRSLDELARSAELAAPIAWVMGNEAWGFSPEHLALVDEAVAIPMWGRAESLNLSTAAAVCLYVTASAQRAAR